MANSSKTKVPLKFGWLVEEEKYHIAITTKKGFKYPVYTCLCQTHVFLDIMSSNWFIWPNGTYCTELLSMSFMCQECLTMYGEDLTFPLIKAKLGVKNPFD